MTVEEAIALMKNEVAYIERANNCDRDCEKCELVREDTELLAALDNAKLFVEHLQNMFNFYNERSKDPHKAIEGDAEFAALIKEHYLPFYQQFFEFVDDLINNGNEQMPQ